MAQLGYNLMRIHHHDSDWVDPNIFGRKPPGPPASLHVQSLDDLDWLIKCLEDEGIYVWLDMHVGRIIHPAGRAHRGRRRYREEQGLDPGLLLLQRPVAGTDERVPAQLFESSESLYELRYKDDPAVIGVLITNEDDATHHGWQLRCCRTTRTRIHGAVWKKGYEAFAREYRLPAARVFQTWAPGRASSTSARSSTSSTRK